MDLNFSLQFPPEDVIELDQESSLGHMETKINSLEMSTGEIKM
jgi:hypothetical protein